MSKVISQFTWHLGVSVVVLLLSVSRFALAAPCVDGSNQTQDLDGSSSNPYTCDVQAGSGTVSFNIDSANNSIEPAGTVFYVVSPLSISPPGPVCTVVTAGEHYTCPNVTVQAPAGSSATATAYSTPVVVTITAPASLSAAETVSFDLTTIDGDLTPEVVRSYQIGLLPADPAYQGVFVLDHSGSMSLTTSSGNTRWQALTTGINAMLPSFNALNPPSGSELGLTLFETTVSPDLLLDGDFVAVEGATASVISSAIPPSPSSGGTAMGPGLENGISKFNASEKNQVILLFTDGEQNIGPKVDPGGVLYDNDDPINPGEVKIITVGIDSPSDLYSETLQALADNNGGVYLEVSGTDDFTGPIPGDIPGIFASTIQPILTGNSPQQIRTISGSVQDDPEVGPFIVNRDVNRLVLIVLLSSELKSSQIQSLLSQFTLERNGIDVTQLAELAFVGQTASSFTVSLPLNTPITPANGGNPTTLLSEGEYSLRFAATGDDTPQLEYRVIGYADDHRLNIDQGIAETAPQAPGNITPTVKLDWIGMPIEDATVTAIVLRPGTDLGALLAEHPAVVDTSDAPDSDNPGIVKYNQLMATDPQFLQALAKSENLLNLTHQGDGVYSAQFPTGDVRGSYQVLYTIEADDNRYGSIRRSSSQTQYVGFGAPSINIEEATLQEISEGFGIVVTPYTGYGKVLGPAQQRLFNVESTGLTLTRVVDLQNGDYRLELSGDPSAEIDITIGGTSVYAGPADDIGPGTFFEQFIDRLLALGLPLWLIVLLLILLGLLLIWWIIRRLR